MRGWAVGYIGDQCSTCPVADAAKPGGSKRLGMGAANQDIVDGVKRHMQRLQKVAVLWWISKAVLAGV